jgi:hypothetical protein
VKCAASLIREQNKKQRVIPQKNPAIECRRGPGDFISRKHHRPLSRPEEDSIGLAFIPPPADAGSVEDTPTDIQIGVP